METIEFMNLTCPPEWYIYETEPVYDPLNPESFMVWEEIWNIIRLSQRLYAAFGIWN